MFTGIVAAVGRINSIESMGTDGDWKREIEKNDGLDVGFGKTLRHGRSRVSRWLVLQRAVLAR